MNKIVFFIWFAAVVYFSLAPSDMGHQFVSAQLGVTGSGFFLHVLGYFILGVMAFYVFEKKRIWWYLAGFFALSAGFELVQYQIPSRSFNVWDLAGNGLGLLAVVPVVWGEKWRKWYNAR